VALSLIPRLSGKLFYTLLAHFGSTSTIISASRADLLAVVGVGETTVKAIHAISLSDTENALNLWQKAGVSCLTLGAEHYPHALKSLEDAPPTLFARGQVERLSALALQECLAIVGTRKPSEKGRTLAFRYAVNASHQGQAVISGMAYGIDAAAHNGALGVEGGFTVAVLGCGVLKPYPNHPHGLTERILERGVMLCECAPDATVSVPRLISRNRLISGLSNPVLMVESSLEGGAMYAVRFAQAQGKPVFTAPIKATGNQYILANGGQAMKL